MPKYMKLSLYGPKEALLPVEVRVQKCRATYDTPPLAY